MEAGFYADSPFINMHLDAVCQNFARVWLTPWKPKILSARTPIRGAPRAPMAPEMHLSKAYTDVLILSGTTCDRKVRSRCRKAKTLNPKNLKPAKLSWFAARFLVVLGCQMPRDGAM